jgi:hypothetical protein
VKMLLSSHVAVFLRVVSQPCANYPPSHKIHVLNISFASYMLCLADKYPNPCDVSLRFHVHLFLIIHDVSCLIIDHAPRALNGDWSCFDCTSSRLYIFHDQRKH